MLEHDEHVGALLKKGAPALPAPAYCASHDRSLRAGDVVKLDVTVEKNGYMADAARTVIVGRRSRRQMMPSSCS